MKTTLKSVSTAIVMALALCLGVTAVHAQDKPSSNGSDIFDSKTPVKPKKKLTAAEKEELDKRMREDSAKLEAAYDKLQNDSRTRQDESLDIARKAGLIPAAKRTESTK